MLTIQRKYWDDLKAAKEHGVQLPNACTKVGLYQAIALYLEIDITGMNDLDTLWAAIEAKNADLACVGIPEKPVMNEVQRPVLRRDRKPVAKPVKRNDLPVVRTLPPASVMAKALAKGGLVIVR
jgi:hypothetical protein